MLLTPFTGWATNATNLVIESADCICDLDKNDKLAGPAQINFGTFAGQCVDSCRFRKSIRLRPKTPVVGVNEASVTISNFMHDNTYWKAKIPVSKVESVDVGFEEFRPGIFHVFLLFHFPKDNQIALYPQGDQNRRSPKRISTLVISPEGIPPKKGAYNLIDAFMERYPIGIRMLSKDQVISWSITKLKHSVETFNLLITAEQVREILRHGLARSDQNSFNIKYGLFSNNCATNVVDLIDAVVKPETSKAPLYFSFLYPFERALSIAGPVGTFKILYSRNLIQPDSGRPILN
ncbi:MAG: DUF4105 domain-containing protein [Bdellovibrionaceae bacterium]|nr:DUF4105 domain-containing protein [Pseudobdellovibrionaceae bacterium]